MKSLFFLLTTTLLLSSFSALAQDISEKYPQLKRRIDQINTADYHNVVKLENEQFMPNMTDGGGTLIGYFHNATIEKITREIVYSYGIERFDYYFTGGQLVFVYETLQGFIYDDKLGEFDYSKTETNFIGCYYFRDKKLIDSETTGHNRFEDDSTDIETTLINEANENLEKFTTRKN